MGIFHLFKNKNTEESFPENDIETALSKVHQKQISAKDFCELLMWSDLFVVLAEEWNKEVEIIDEDEEIELMSLEGGEIAVFSSESRIYDFGRIKNEVPVIALKGQELLKLLRGHQFVLNPFSEVSRAIVSCEESRLFV